ncbi:hypothetical protein DWB61_02055 [Ancylomarina euxinus]|uniref:Uncharacterized protein n=2 Tax=Ancylomarina euxinus TaxID=2283627 RepID=A0A425Y8A9_9BACT|nr:hypothetical protein DWB61_02055 [Ancylomarina euxinus]
MSFNSTAQVAPVGKKTLEVKETFTNEYLKEITNIGLSSAVINALNKRVPKKLEKYGFSNIAIEEIGKVNGVTNLKFQTNIIDNTTGNRFKIRLNSMTYSPQYIIKEIKPLKTKKVVIKENIEDYCNSIIVEKDKFTNKTKYHSPYINPISFLRVQTDSSITNYMSIQVSGSTINVGIKGVIILFKDGTKIERPNVEVDSKVSRNGGGFTYSAFFNLEKEEIETLSQKIISDVRLYIYDSEIKDGIKYQEYLKCIEKM